MGGADHDCWGGRGKAETGTVDRLASVSTDADASILLRTAAAVTFRPLVRDAGLRAFLEVDVFAAIKPCEGAQ